MSKIGFLRKNMLKLIKFIIKTNIKMSIENNNFTEYKVRSGDSLTKIVVLNF
jgi:hypothetical protein